MHILVFDSGLRRNDVLKTTEICGFFYAIAVWLMAYPVDKRGNKKIQAPVMSLVYLAGDLVRACGCFLMKGAACRSAAADF